MQLGVESVAAVAAVQTGVTPSGGVQMDPSSAASAPSTFANLLQQQVVDLNANLGAAETAMGNLAAGKPVELHEVMISLEQARISVQTFLQVRNTLVGAWQDLMRMQI